MAPSDRRMDLMPDLFGDYDRMMNGFGEPERPVQPRRHSALTPPVSGTERNPYAAAVRRPAVAQPRAENGILGVGEAVERLRNALGGLLAGIWISGEVSNLSRPSSGHVYFTLKDGTGQLRCVYFRGSQIQAAPTFRIGDRIEVRGTPDVYSRSGDLQLRLSTWRPAGIGALYEAYLRLKERLGAEGLFDAGRKRAVPGFVRRIAVVTSPQAAALQDVIRTVTRRTPWVRLYLSPALVQGTDAPASLCRALARADRAGADVVLLVRGGGSFEDLYCFNDEQLVRRIAAMRTPVIAGIGHETDETLASLAADLCASTPTAAAELTGRDGAALHDLLNKTEQRLTVSLDRLTDDAELALDDNAARLRQSMDAVLGTAVRRTETAGRMLASPALYLSERQQRLMQSASLLRGTAAQILAARAGRLSALSLSLQAPVAQCRNAQLRLRKAGSLLTVGAERTVARCEGTFLAYARHFPDPDRLLGAREAALSALTQSFLALNPERPLQQGYALVQRQGTPLTGAAQVRPGETLTVKFADGEVTVTAESVAIRDSAA